MPSDIILTDVEPKEPRTFFSILTPAWNAGEFINECLDSLLTQTFPSWEHFDLR